MNKRQKKKLYKKRTDCNPPKVIKYSHETYRIGIQEGKSFLEELKEWAQSFREQLRKATKYLTNTYFCYNYVETV